MAVVPAPRACCYVALGYSGEALEKSTGRQRQISSSAADEVALDASSLTISISDTMQLVRLLGELACGYEPSRGNTSCN
jgi:hypothetical protein